MGNNNPVDDRFVKVAALTAGRFDPSSRFRVRQHIINLESLGVQVHEFIPLIDIYTDLPLGINTWHRLLTYPFLLPWKAVKLACRIPGVLCSWRNQVTWLGRYLLSGFPSLEYFLKRPLVLDVDDAAWLDCRFYSAVARNSDAVIAGNAYVANWFESYSQNIFIIPTAIDTQVYRPANDSQVDQNDRFVIGYSGSHSNLKYLRIVEAPLRKFLLAHPDVRFLVMSDKSPDLKEFPPNQFYYVPWTVADEVPTFNQMDVGIMPLTDDIWTRGKCSFKMLQYMSCGIPVIVSPVGMNVEVLAKGQSGFAARSEAEWYDAFLYLYENRSNADIFGQTGRRVVEQFYDVKMISKQLAEIFLQFQ